MAVVFCCCWSIECALKVVAASNDGGFFKLDMLFSRVVGGPFFFLKKKFYREVLGVIIFN